MRTTTRRVLLRQVGAALAAAPLAPLLGCGSSGSSDVGPDDDGGPSLDAGGRVDAAPGLDGGRAVDAGGGAWATGGTASMAGGYPDPFAGGVGETCALTCAATLGPCYAATLVRRDISEGQPGLPMRMAFLVVDERCKPVEGAEVDVWHTAPFGVYSGDDTPALCTNGDASARAARWFRGVQATNAHGRADFDSCFPGWYSGRTIHVHFTIRLRGAASVTSQLFFDDALSDDILGRQPIYSDRGPRDTTNANDSVVSAGGASKYSFETARMPDGALLAAKAIVVRAPGAGALCRIPPGGVSGG